MGKHGPTGHDGVKHVPPVAEEQQLAGTFDGIDGRAGNSTSEGQGLCRIDDPIIHAVQHVELVGGGTIRLRLPESSSAAMNCCAIWTSMR